MNSTSHGIELFSSQQLIMEPLQRYWLYSIKTIVVLTCASDVLGSPSFNSQLKHFWFSLLYLTGTHVQTTFMIPICKYLGQYRNAFYRICNECVTISVTTWFYCILYMSHFSLWIKTQNTSTPSKRLMICIMWLCGLSSLSWHTRGPQHQPHYSFS